MRLSPAAGRRRISTHAPRTGSDRIVASGSSSPMPFQPTLPARGATRRNHYAEHADFNPRSPHGERPPAPARTQAIVQISTHAPRTGSDKERAFLRTASTVFQPTLPARGATAATIELCALHRNFNPRSPHGERHTQSTRIPMPIVISTHAPRTGSDFCRFRADFFKGNFNPRSPHGERLVSAMSALQSRTDFNPRSPHGERRSWQAIRKRLQAFQPTLPARGATDGKELFVCCDGFQPTLPARGATGKERARYTVLRNFNPRSPHGERRAETRVACKT